MSDQPPMSLPPSSGTSGALTALSILLGLGVCLMMTAVGVGLLWLASQTTRTPVAPGHTAAAVLASATLATGNDTPASQPTVMPSPTATTTRIPATHTPAPPTPAPTTPPPPTAEPTAAVQEAEVTTAAAAACTPPEDWVVHYVEPGQTLFAFVVGAGGTITTDDLRQANCLTTDLLQIGQALYLPPGAADNAPSSDPPPVAEAQTGGPRAADCAPHCTISIRPGWRAEQIAAAIDNVPVNFWGSDFLAAVGAGAPSAYGFLASRPAGQGLEGFLFPGTYELRNADTPESFRDMLLAAFAANLPAAAEASAAAHGLSLYEAITLASIIQRESWAYSEQVLISSVFHNRLRGGGSLGATVTLQYALGYAGNWWPPVRGSQVNTASPYNTNLNAGLPPSPISNPGVEAIRAALQPADTNYLFFTGNCNGSGNVYATTFEEHLANVNACN